MQKHFFNHSWTILTITGLLALPYISHANPNNDENQLVKHCDTSADKLTVSAKRAPLFKLLGEISKKCGIEILIDPTVNREINTKFSNMRLDQGLKRISRGLSYTFFYNQKSSKDNANKQYRISAVHILPQGKEDSGNLVPLRELHRGFKNKANRERAQAKIRSNRHLYGTRRTHASGSGQGKNKNQQGRGKSQGQTETIPINENKAKLEPVPPHEEGQRKKWGSHAQ